MSDKVIARSQAAILVIAPMVLFAALVYHPYIPQLTDKAAVAAALASGPTRWGFAHLAVAVGFGLMLLAFLAIRRLLSQAGEERWSITGLPFIAMGSTFSALLPAMEIAMLAPAEVGADVEASQQALDVWFMPVFFSGAVLSALGILGFAMGIVASGVLSRGLARVVAGALFVMAVSRFIPLGAALYVGGAAGILALWPLANHILNQSARLGRAVRYSSPTASSKA